MLSKRLKKLREQKEVYQKDVADYIGVSERVYGFYEAGRFPKDEIILTKLADYFNVTVDYLIGRTDEPNIELIDRGLPKQLLDEGIEAIGVFKDIKLVDLTTEDIQRLVDFAKQIKNRQS